MTTSHVRYTAAVAEEAYDRAQRALRMAEANAASARRTFDKALARLRNAEAEIPPHWVPHLRRVADNGPMARDSILDEIADWLEAKS